MIRLLLTTICGCWLVTACTSKPSSKSRTAQLSDVQRLPSWELEEARYYWGTHTYLTGNTPPSGTPESWCEIANDESQSRETRCVAAAILLGDYVRPGFNSDDMRRVIPDPNWLQEATFSIFGLTGGRFPFTVEGSHFYLELFRGPDERTRRTYWRVDFTLTRGTPDEIVSVEEAAAFLRGKLADRTVRIQESIMMYPLPKTEYGQVEEMHNRKGVGIKVSTGGWFD